MTVSVSLSETESAKFETTKSFVTSKTFEFVSVSTSVMISVSPVREFVNVTLIVSRTDAEKFWSVSVMYTTIESPSFTVAGKTPEESDDGLLTRIGPPSCVSVVSVGSV